MGYKLFSSSLIVVALLSVITLLYPDGQGMGEDAVPSFIAYEDEIRNISSVSQPTGLWGRLTAILVSSPKPMLRQPMGIDAKNGWLAVTDAGNNGVHLLQRKKQKYTFIPLPDPGKNGVPIEVALAEKSVYFTCSRSNVIYRYGLDGTLYQAIPIPAEIPRVTGIAIYSNRIYVVATPIHKVFVLDHGGEVVQTFGYRGQSDGELNYPTFITIGENGIIYITDTMNFRVQSYNLRGEPLASIGTRGVRPGRLNRPKGIALDSQFNLFVVDASFDNIQVFSKDNVFMEFFGRSGKDHAQFLMPTDVAIDGSTIYVSDTMNNRIQIFRIHEN